MSFRPNVYCVDYGVAGHMSLLVSQKSNFLSNSLGIRTEIDIIVGSFRSGNNRSPRRTPNTVRGLSSKWVGLFYSKTWNLDYPCGPLSVTCVECYPGSWTRVDLSFKSSRTSSGSVSGTHV